MKNETENTTQETPLNGEAVMGAEAVLKLEAENAELKTGIRLSAAKEMMVSSLARAVLQSTTRLSRSIQVRCARLRPMRMVAMLFMKPFRAHTH